MALFNSRKAEKTTTKTPAAAKSYLPAEQKHQMWRVWALSIVTFIGTIIVVLGLFAGGRWVYREIKNNNSQETVSTTPSNESNKESGKQSQGNSSDNSGDSTSGTSATPAPSAAPSTTTTPTAPSTTSNSSQLVNTGPSGPPEDQ